MRNSRGAQRWERAMSEQSSETDLTSTRSAASVPTPRNPAVAGTIPPQKRATRWRKMLLGAGGVLILAGAIWFGIPWIRMTLDTVSTDDAYVNGHVTFVAARVRGQVSRVLVDDNNRVHKGDLLVELDTEPFQIAVAIKKAAVATAAADLEAAKARVRGIEAEARSRRWALQHAVEDVDNKVGLLRARVAGLDKSSRRARAGSGRLRPGSQIGGVGRHPKVGIRPAAGGLVGGPCGRHRGAGRCPSNPRLFGIAA